MFETKKNKKINIFGVTLSLNTTQKKERKKKNQKKDKEISKIEPYIFG